MRLRIWDEGADEKRRPRPGLRQAVALLGTPDRRVIDQIANLVQDP